MRCSRGVGMLVVLALIGIAPSVLASPPRGSASVSSGSAVLARSCSALRYPRYEYSQNYCGPEWLQEAGLGWVVPRDPVIGIDFNPACYGHDACYSECCQNGMSQAACDAQFEESMTSICSQNLDEHLDACPWWGYPLCAPLHIGFYLNCLAMAGTYRTAVSMLGDGVIDPVELGVAITPIVGPFVATATALAVYAVAGEIEIEAAYPCPCACLTCPPDEPVGEPDCQITASGGAEVSQGVIRYLKEEAVNVSGQGPTCDCSAVAWVITTPCPAGSTCDSEGRVCASDLCDPATCNGAELVSRCRQFGFTFLGVEVILYSDLVYDWVTSRCEAVDEYRSECVTTTHHIASIPCPEGCAEDGFSCAGRPASTLQLRVMQPAALDATSYVPCAGCRLQLEGIGGTREGTTAIDGTVTFSEVPQGIYLARYGCGPATLGPHLPSDLVLYPSAPVSWVLARRPHMVADSDLPTIVAPLGGPVDVLAGSCAAEGAAACSADQMSPVPTAQTLPAAVAATRRRIIEAATACNYGALAALAASGDNYFAYGDDPAGNPATYWRSLEAGGGEPLGLMVITLNLPVESAAVGGTEGAYYLWSDGYGGVTNYRMGISATGEWLFFLPDD